MRSAETVDWRDTDLTATFDAVESDVRAAAMAEARFGAGREEPDFLYVSVGTGISHCLMVDGRPRLGVREARSAPARRSSSNGRAGSRSRAARATRPPRRRSPTRRAADVVEEGARRLGLALAALVNALDPGALIVGGGLGLDDSYRARVEAALRAAIYDPDARDLPLLPAALGADAAVIGAALVAVASVPCD